jgi:REP element-mobilizing transposase RayT
MIWLLQMRSQQKDFFTSKSEHGPNRIEWGGADKKGNDRRIGQRKVQRPFDRKNPISITMKASRAKDKLSMLGMKNRTTVEALLEICVKQSGGKVHRFANVGNHIHLLMSFRSRRAFQSFLRSFSGRVARAITGARKGKPFGKFWDALAHSRVIVGAKAYGAIDRYIFANQLEVDYGYEGREFFRKNRTETWITHPDEIPDEYKPR